MLRVKVVANEGHLNLDAAERAREVLPQFTIFCNKQIPKDIFSVKKRKKGIPCIEGKGTIMMKRNSIFLLHLLHVTEQQPGSRRSAAAQH
jgi:hypothetical protein